MEKLFEPFKKYLQAEKKAKKNTLGAYSSDIRHFLDSIADSDNKELTVDDLRTYLARLSDQKLSASSLSRKIFALRSFYEYAKQYHGIENIATKLATPKRDKRKPRLLDHDDLVKLLATAESDHSARGLRNQIMIRLLCETGMKISELVALSYADLSLEKGTVSIRQLHGKRRVAPLSSSLNLLLQEYCATLSRSTKGYLFPVMKRGSEQPMTRQGCWLVINTLWKKSGIKREIFPEMLRQASGTCHLKTSNPLSPLRELYDKKHPRS